MKLPGIGEMSGKGGGGRMGRKRRWGGKGLVTLQGPWRDTTTRGYYRI